MTDRSILFSAPAVATPDMVRAALDLVWEESKNNDELVCNIWQAMATKCQSRQSYVDCVCTKIQQDEHCLVGYPSLLCEICYGKGVVPYVKLDGPELWEIVFGIANEVAHKITDDQYTKIADAINSVFIEPAPYPALGWIYFNEDVGTEFSVDHPVESGACPDAQDIRPATADNLRDEMLSGWKAWAEDRGELDKHRNEPSSRTQALEEAAKFIDKRVSEYVQEHGVTDPETGTVEFPGWGDEYVSELEELAEGIRALSSQPVADHIADAGKMVADARQFKLGDRLTKKTGSSWTGLVVGFYSTELTPIGYAIESETEKGSVQIYPEAALRHLPASPGGSV